MNSQKRNRTPRRVVVTGIGVVAPNGIGADAYCTALRDGVSGVAAISLFNADNLDCRVAAEVKNFHCEDSLSRQEARRVGRAVPLLLAATQEALRQAGTCWQRLSLEDKQSWGVVIGSGGGEARFYGGKKQLGFFLKLGPRG